MNKFLNNKAKFKGVNHSNMSFSNQEMRSVGYFLFIFMYCISL